MSFFSNILKLNFCYKTLVENATSPWEQFWERIFSGKPFPMIVPMAKLDRQVYLLAYPQGGLRIEHQQKAAHEGKKLEMD